MDDWGSKSSILFLHGIGLAMYIGLMVMKRYPQLYSYLVQLTEENIKKHNALGRSLIVALKFSMALIFMMLIASGFRFQKGHNCQ